ncbi:hypothetical protein ACX0HA_03290 [Flavobacterium hauense]
MKLIKVIILLFGFLGLAQENTGELLLLRVDIERNLQIDRETFGYFALEMKDGKLSNDLKSVRVFFDGFTDANIISCIKRDSINLSSLFKDDSFEHETKYLNEYDHILKSNLPKMHELMKLDVRSSLYNEKVKISYLVIKANYCRGIIAKRDSEMMGVENDIILVIKPISFDSTYTIPKSYIYDIVKAINFNSFLF